MVLHAKLYKLGDKYNVLGLKDLSRRKFLRACVKYWNHDQLPTAADYAFTTTTEDDKGLWEITCNLISLHMELLNKPAVEALLHEFNGLATDVLKLSTIELGWIKPS
jgi:hypothetical protein